MATLFAEMSTESILAIAGVVMFAFKLAEKVYDNRRADKAAAIIATKVEEVKAQAVTSAAEVKVAVEASDANKKAHLDRQDKKLEEIGNNVNGMNAIIAATNLAQGLAEGKAIGLEQGREEGKP